MDRKTRSDSDNRRRRSHRRTNFSEDTYAGRYYTDCEDENGYFETNLSLESGGNYIMVNYEDFTGIIELYSEYEGAEVSKS